LCWNRSSPSNSFSFHTGRAEGHALKAPGTSFHVADLQNLALAKADARLLQGNSSKKGLPFSCRPSLGAAMDA
jgi:hypothetical protein